MLSEKKSKPTKDREGHVWHKLKLEEIKAHEDSYEVRHRDSDVEEHHGGYNPR